MFGKKNPFNSCNKYSDLIKTCKADPDVMGFVMETMFDRVINNPSCAAEMSWSWLTGGKSTQKGWGFSCMGWSVVKLNVVSVSAALGFTQLPCQDVSLLGMEIRAAAEALGQDPPPANNGRSRQSAGVPGQSPRKTLSLWWRQSLQLGEQRSWLRTLDHLFVEG